LSKSSATQSSTSSTIPVGNNSFHLVFEDLGFTDGFSYCLTGFSGTSVSSLCIMIGLSNPRTSQFHCQIMSSSSISSTVARCPGFFPGRARHSVDCSTDGCGNEHFMLPIRTDCHHAISVCTKRAGKDLSQIQIWFVAGSSLILNLCMKPMPMIVSYQSTLTISK
jgi:hypothetical protein